MNVCFRHFLSLSNNNVSGMLRSPIIILEDVNHTSYINKSLYMVPAEENIFSSTSRREVIKRVADRILNFVYYTIASPDDIRSLQKELLKDLQNTEIILKVIDPQ